MNRGLGLNPESVIVALLSLALGGCGIVAQSHLVASAKTVSVATFSRPKSVDGIPVHFLSWRDGLPGVGGLPWHTVPPKSFGISPAAALRHVLSSTTVRAHTQAIYVQAAGVRGGGIGDPASAYLVELLGQFGLHPAGPDVPKPPTVGFAVLIVNGRTGASQLLMTGLDHGTVRDGRAVLTPPEPSTPVSKPAAGSSQPKPTWWSLMSVAMVNARQGYGIAPTGDGSTAILAGGSGML